MMTNEEYIKTLGGYIEELKILRKKCVTLAAEIIGQTLMEDDLFFCAAADRCLRLIDGAIPMLETRNLTCFGPLLRMQMDNCMRTYAAFIAEDRNAVIKSVIDGTPIKNLKDKNGKKFTDGHLKDELSLLDPKFAQVYEQASGYVHLSEKAFYQTVEDVEDSTICFNIGHPLPEKRNIPLIEGAEAYIHFVRLHFKMLQAVADSKKRYDTEHVDELDSDT